MIVTTFRSCNRLSKNTSVLNNYLQSTCFQKQRTLQNVRLFKNFYHNLSIVYCPSADQHCCVVKGPYSCNLSYICHIVGGDLAMGRLMNTQGVPILFMHTLFVSRRMTVFKHPAVTRVSKKVVWYSAPLLRIPSINLAKLNEFFGSSL